MVCNKDMKRSGSMRGNALFLILIAVALFAALSYALTQSSRGGGSSISKEKDQISAAQIVQAANVMRAGAQRLRLSGVAAGDIRLHPDGDRHVPCTNTDGTCIFTADGGGALPLSLPEEAFGYYMPPQNIVYNEVQESLRGTNEHDVVIEGIGTDAADGVMFILGLKKSVCENLNKGLGITGIPVVNADIDTIHKITATPGQAAACLDFSTVYATPELYCFYQVIVEN